MGGACRQPSEVTCQVDRNLIFFILFLSWAVNSRNTVTIGYLIATHVL
jgi:hypothetical protein